MNIKEFWANYNIDLFQFCFVLYILWNLIMKPLANGSICSISCNIRLNIIFIIVRFNIIFIFCEMIQFWKIHYFLNHNEIIYAERERENWLKWEFKYLFRSGLTGPSNQVVARKKIFPVKLLFCHFTFIAKACVSHFSVKKPKTSIIIFLFSHT
jgi:hypothetical protein